MARTRARGRTDDISESSAASESESAVSENDAGRRKQQQRVAAGASLASGAAGMLVHQQHSESETEDAAHQAMLNNNNNATRRSSPRKRGSLSARKSGARPSLPSVGAIGDEGKGKKVFKPARSARKTTAPSSSASRQRTLPTKAAMNAFADSSLSDAASDSDALLESEAEETQYQTAPTYNNNNNNGQKRKRSSEVTRRNGKGRARSIELKDEDEDDGNDTTVWVPVDSPEHGDEEDDEDEAATTDPKTLAREARNIIERAFKGDFIRLSKKKRSTLSSFLHSMDTQDDTNQDTEVEERLLREFELSIQNAGPDFSINELLDITAYILVFSNPNDAETPTALVQGLPLALDNFAASLVPQGMRLTSSILQLQLALRIQLIIARGRVAHEILEDDNLDIMNEDQNLALRFVDDGQEALWDEHQRRSAQTIATILDGDSDVDELVAEYPIEDFLTAFLKHVKRVFTYLRRPLKAAAEANTIASSPSKYFEHIARKRLKVDEARRRSAPPPQRGSSAAVESPYSHLRESLRNARKSSPIRRPPPAFNNDNLNPRPFQAIGTSRVQENSNLNDQSIREDSDEEVEDELITRSSAQLGSEQDSAVDETITQERIDEGDAGMSVDDKAEIEVEVEVEETQTVETQVVQRNLLDRSALGAFLETQADSQLGESQNQSQGDDDFWHDNLENGNGTHAPAVQDHHEDVGLYDGDPYIRDSQASQSVPGRSDAPSPSLANPQSYDGGQYDPFEQDQLAESVANDEVELELEEENVHARRLDGDAAEINATQSAPLDGEPELGATYSQSNVPDAGNDSSERGSPPQESQALPQSLPPRRGGARKGASWFERQQDAERISMSSPAEKMSGQSAASKRAAHARAARKSTAPRGQSVAAPQPEHAEAQENEQIPPSSRTRAAEDTVQTRRKDFQYVDVEAGEGAEESEDSMDVVANRQTAKDNAASAPAPVKRRPGRPRKNAVDPEQGTTRVTLPTRKSGRTTAINEQRPPSASGSALSMQVQTDYEEVPETGETDGIRTPARRLAREMADEYVDELEEEDEESVPVASTSRATRRTSGRGAVTKKATPAKGKPKTKTAATTTTAAAKGKGKARATSASAAEASNDDEAQANAGELPEDDGLNDVDQLREKRELFAEAMKAWREGLVQSDRFREIKEQYNAITLMHPEYVDKPATKKTGWSALERKIFLVAMDLMRNPFASRRYKSILQDHGINGVVTRGLKDRKSSQLKDKGENIRLLHQNHPVDNPAFAFFQEQLDVNGTIVHAPSRKKKKGGRGRSEVDDDDIEDPDE